MKLHHLTAKSVGIDAKRVHIFRFSPANLLKILVKYYLLRLQSHGAIYRPDSFVFMLRYCVSLKAIRYESTSLNRIVTDKSHRVIVALGYNYTVQFIAPILLY